MITEEERIRITEILKKSEDIQSQIERCKVFLTNLLIPLAESDHLSIEAKTQYKTSGGVLRDHRVQMYLPRDDKYRELFINILNRVLLELENENENLTVNDKELK